MKANLSDENRSDYRKAQDHDRLEQVRTAMGAAAFTHALRDGTAAAMRKDGVDFADKKAVADWVRENPELSRELQNQALQAAVAAGAGQVAGDAAGRFADNPVGRFMTKKRDRENDRRNTAS